MRSVAFAILMALFAGPVFAVKGVDLPGHDYANFPAPSAYVCRTSCGGESRCQAYSWVRPGVQGPEGRCWLKSSLPAIVKNPCCDAGPRHFIAKSDLRAEDGIDRPGSDFKNFEIDSWKTCEATCAQSNLCSSWTYVRPGIQGAAGRCWLKNAVAHPVANANMVSGVKYRPASVVID